MNLFGFWGSKEDPPSWEMDLVAEAERLWAINRDLPIAGVYVSPFGEHKFFPVRLEDIDAAIEFLTKLKQENEQ